MIILQTKVTRPHGRTNGVPRAHLYTTLNNSLDKNLILVTAAAGYGKTTLISQWSQQQTTPICWLALDEQDNDPIRFLTYLTVSIQTQHPHIGQELMVSLQSQQPPSPETAVVILLNQLLTSPTPTHLILDDYHLIHTESIHQAITQLINHLPTHITLIILSRSEPPLPLARWRVRHQLQELQAAHLQFSTKEATHFLQQTMALPLDNALIQILVHRTEGWVAALQLAAIALQNNPDPTQFIHQFSGTHHTITDYLLTELLQQQPEPIRHFLYHTAHLHRLNQSLCDFVTNSQSSQTTLTYLEKQNLFLIPLDLSREWYRYHHLFADLLKAYQQNEIGVSTHTILYRAAIWHKQNDLLEEAVDYALAAQAFDYAAQLITHPAMHLAQHNQVKRLLGWYHAFPQTFVEQNPELSLQFGIAFALNGRWAEAQARLSQITEEDVSHSDKLLLTYLVASHHQDDEQLHTLAAKAQALTNPTPLTQMALGLIVGVIGNIHEACQHLAQAQRASQQQTDHELALTILFHRCRLHVFAGTLHQAHHLCQQALQQIEQIGPSALPLASFAYVSLARIHLEWYQLTKATTYLQKTVTLSQRSGFVTGILSSATMMLAEIKQAQGHSKEALTLAQEALTYAQQHDPPHEQIWLGHYQMRLWLQQGNVPTAVYWWQTNAIPTPPPSRFYPKPLRPITQARLLLAQQQPNKAIRLLTNLLNQPSDLFQTECLALLALARQAQGDTSHAHITLQQALIAGQKRQQLHPFSQLGQPIINLLNQIEPSDPMHPFTTHLLQTIIIPSTPPPTLAPLSQRELAVLHLIVAGQTNQEIATNLTVAPSTVKWYINTLYKKLHVKNRAQAIRRAQALGIFE